MSVQGGPGDEVLRAEGRSAVVIGAGFAGLSAAAALADGGVRPLVVDARPRLGGRATAFRDRETGEMVDNGQHVMFGCYYETMKFLQRIGAVENVRVQEKLEIPFLAPDGRRSVLSCPRLPPPWHLLAGVLGWDALPMRDRLSAIRLAGVLTRGASGVDPELTVAAWLRARRQSARLTEWLWEPLAVAALNQGIEEAAAAPFVRVLADLFGPGRLASALVLPSVPLDRMYAEPARAFIESRGGEVRTNAVARVMTDGTRVTGVQVRGQTIASEAVVSTVPWHQLSTLFGDLPASLRDLAGNASRMESMPIVTVNLWYDRVVMDDQFVGLPARAMQWVFDKRRAFGETASHLSLVSSAAATLTAVGSGELIERAAKEVSAALPRARDATLVRATVVREKHATFSLSPGQPPRPGTVTALPGFYLAGDWTDTGLPGTIEGAVMSGHRAAREVISRQLGMIDN